MSEPTEKDYEAARAHVREMERLRWMRGLVETSDPFPAVRAYLARALAAAREDGRREGSVADFERGRSIGIETAALVCEESRARIIRLMNNGRHSRDTLDSLDNDAELWGKAADAVRALIPQEPAPSQDGERR